MQLIIGNKNYSSWSMRPWVLLREAGIAFEEVQLKFDDTGHAKGAERYSPTGKLPVLVIDGEPVWDSLAICESVAERYPEKQLWPADARARRVARSICAEMHSGFQALRGEMPMNIRSRHPGKGRSPESQRDIERVVQIWTTCLDRHGALGPLLFGRFSIADAYYAPVVTRFQTYAVSLPPAAQAYCDAVLALRAVREWMDAARRETEFVAGDEPYASDHR
ncbi:MAG: glutathione S-transferase family protein [Betaproteobacteria bacterium]|nr:MAG: glutathione S-transferase family protein [Betaproteobacteria bacterium]TMH45250.1 MAG: glutathione S-transferase family protein [Betaproteobacteria bacterium]